MQLSGHAFAPRSSQRCEAFFHLEQNEVGSQQWVLALEGQRFCYPLQDVEFSAPVGNMPIRLQLPDGRMFITQRTSELDKWLKSQQRWTLKLDWLERHWIAWLSSGILCLVLLVSGYHYALPWVGSKTAQALPERWSLLIGDQVLDTLDHIYQPSQLSMDQQNAIRSRVAGYLEKLPVMPFSIEIEFRSSPGESNAFALPGGKMVILDDLVAMMENPRQLDAIIMHELGHIYHRHMLTRLVQSSIISVAVAVMTGEASGVIDNMAGVGVFLLANQQSRRNEQQADAFARQAMMRLFDDHQALAKAFERLKQQPGLELPQWLSTHPDIEQRIRDAQISP
ncbi:M48 family metallopeptidase [Vibrio olivae]|uniref:M48 family metallopeptidase n=1 Tax=Vibrio olivae TaxID=1243002 RepID=A0ABV5HS88_9VIBR